MLHPAGAVMQVESYAKINWSLRVTAKRADGFHDLETLFQTISLHDTLTFRESERLELTCSDRTIPTDERNLVMRAARALGVENVAIHIDKRIPAGGGLGGGSSNAAATLLALSKMFGIDAPLAQLALQLGSDVPFFLVGGTAYATGRGEVITPLADEWLRGSEVAESRGETAQPRNLATSLLLILPRARVSTADAFRAIRTYSPPLGPDAYRDMRNFTNDFEEPVFARLPELRQWKERLYALGATWAQMTGSGSTIVGAFADSAARDAALAQISGVRAEPAECVGRAV
jgi:4-diphosphocytidyl-2-C-methyl-D-erythritol kinase